MSENNKLHTSLSIKEKYPHSLLEFDMDLLTSLTVTELARLGMTQMQSIKVYAELGGKRLNKKPVQGFRLTIGEIGNETQWNVLMLNLQVTMIQIRTTRDWNAENIWFKHPQVQPDIVFRHTTDKNGVEYGLRHLDLSMKDLSQPHEWERQEKLWDRLKNPPWCALPRPQPDFRNITLPIIEEAVEEIRKAAVKQCQQQQSLATKMQSLFRKTMIRISKAFALKSKD